MVPESAAQTLRAAHVSLDQRALQQIAGYNIRQAEARVMKNMERVFRVRGIRPSEYSLLVLLAHNDRVTASDMADTLNIHRPNLVKLVARLEEAGWLTRIVDAQDRRNQILTLTERGRAFLDEATPAALAQDQWLVREMEPAGRRVLVDLLKRLYAPDAEARLNEGELARMVGYHVRQADALMMKYSEPCFRLHDIRPTEYSVLSLLEANAGVTSSDVAEALLIHRPNMAKLVARLEGKGLLARTVSDADRRNQILSLTDAGSAHLAQLHAALRTQDLKMTQRLNPAERSELIALLQRLYA